MTHFDEFVNWVQTFQDDRQAPVFKPKKGKQILSSAEEEVTRLRSVLYSREDGCVGATENGYLAGLNEEAPEKVITPPPSGMPKIPGSLESFLTTEAVKEDMGSIMCRSVSTPAVERSNEFTGYIYGIESHKNVALMMDVRYENKDFIIADDPESTCMLHVDCIVADAFIPDWRWLLTNPEKGLKLVYQMEELSLKVAVDAWRDERWRSFVNPQDRDSFSDADVRTNLISGFSIGRSGRNQLHLTVMCPPFVPSHFHSLLKNELFIYRQWFPLEYVLKILTLCVRRGIKLTVEDVGMPIEALIAFFDDIPYDVIHTRALQRYARSHHALAHFRMDMFEYVVSQDKIIPTKRATGGKEKPKHESDRNALWNHDRAVLTAAGARKQYYSFPKQFPLPTWQ